MKRSKRTKKQPRNSFEKDVLHRLNRLGLKPEYETLKLPYTLQAIYEPDFITPEIIFEGKGYFRAADRRKMVAIKKQYPHLRIVLVFQKPELTISKNSKTTYAEWAVKNGYEWCTVKDLKRYV